MVCDDLDIQTDIRPVTCLGLESGRETGRLEMERDVDKKDEKLKCKESPILVLNPMYRSLRGWRRLPCNTIDRLQKSADIVHA
jgi:hypothetical protein